VHSFVLLSGATFRSSTVVSWPFATKILFVTGSRAISETYPCLSS